MAGITIRTTAIMATPNHILPNHILPRLGIIAPILPAITLMWRSAIPAGKRFQPVDVCAAKPSHGSLRRGVKRSIRSLNVSDPLKIKYF